MKSIKIKFIIYIFLFNALKTSIYINKHKNLNNLKLNDHLVSYVSSPGYIPNKNLMEKHEATALNNRIENIDHNYRKLKIKLNRLN